MSKTALGLERFAAEPPAWAGSARLGLLTHPAAVDSAFRSSVEVVAGLAGGRLVALFGPQHGFLGDKQDNMIESADFRHPVYGIPVYSLYGQTRTPTAEMLAGLDVLLIDLQDVGCRVYTYIQTLKLTLEACGRAGVKAVVLDRPNPIGRAVEGNLLAEGCRSFVGLFELPMRHGLTLGEMARWLVVAGGAAEVEVIGLKNYDPEAYFEATGLPWVLPSPNMPSVATAVVYPGQVLFEGVKVSEGRGTTRPFEMFGAPFVEPYRLAGCLAEYNLPGVCFRPVFFEPTFNKHAGRLCGGVYIHVTDRRFFLPYRTSLACLQALFKLWPEETALAEPPYEYEYDRRPINLILGRADLADEIAAGRDIMELESGWAADLARFEAERNEIFLYRGRS